MGHLHTSGAELSEDDTAERPIIGGMESISPSCFPKALKYVALGHIHKAQALGNAHIRYAGSPIPLSFSEKHYTHQVVTFSIENGQVQGIKSIPLPLHTPLLSIPERALPPEEVLHLLTALPEATSESPAPYLEVKVLLKEPAPELKDCILKTIANKHVRLARIDVRYQQQNKANQTFLQSELTLNDLQPYEVLQRVYENKYHEPLPDFYKLLFEEAMGLVESEK